MCTDILNIKTSNQLIPLSCTKLRNQPERAEQPRSDLSKSERAKATQSHLQRVRASNQPIGNLQTKLCIYSSFYILYNKVEKSKCVIFLSFYYLLFRWQYGGRPHESSKGAGQTASLYFLDIRVGRKFSVWVPDNLNPRLVRAWGGGQNAFIFDDEYILMM